MEETSIVTQLFDRLALKAADADAPMRTLSGGNQQKVVLGRWLIRNPPVLLLDEPTRGIDVGSIEYIHSRIVEERDAGAAVLIVSSELDEILALADRILVMYRGQIVAEVEGDEATPAQLGLYMAGAVA